MNYLLSILLQAETTTPEAAKGGIPWDTILMFALIFVVFYFFMIRPQQKKQKELQEARSSMKTGDKVLLNSGIYGKIREVKSDSFIVEIADGVRIKVDKSVVLKSPENGSGSEDLNK
jgi:preprotein translocase subunit YajC